MAPIPVDERAGAAVVTRHWRREWTIEVVGTISGRATKVTFLRFGSQKAAEQWIHEHQLNDELTFWRAVKR